MLIEPDKETSAWSASDFPTPRGWVHSLSETHINEIMDAVRRAQRDELAFHQLNLNNFSLHKTRELLDEVSGELHGRPGFAVLAGLPVQEMTQEQSMLAYGGIMSHIGQISDQTRKGDMSVDVKDV